MYFDDKNDAPHKHILFSPLPSPPYPLSPLSCCCYSYCIRFWRNCFRCFSSTIQILWFKLSILQMMAESDFDWKVAFKFLLIIFVTSYLTLAEGAFYLGWRGHKLWRMQWKQYYFHYSGGGNSENVHIHALHMLTFVLRLSILPKHNPLLARTIQKWLLLLRKA